MHSCRRTGCETPHDEVPGTGSAFDQGFHECEETKVAYLYARIEDAITDLQDAKISKSDIAQALQKALRASDENI